MLVKPQDQSQGCTGVFIAKDLILTAAHCFDGVNAVAGTDLDGTLANGLGFQFEVERIHIPSGYNVTGGDCLGFCSDIAIMKIDTAANTTALLQIFSKPADLNFEPVTIGEKVKITGYGCEQMDTFANCTDSLSLYRGYWKIATTSVVNDTNQFNPIGGAYFSTEGSDARNTPGDSGGPVFNSANEIIGVNSWRISYTYFDNSYHTKLSLPRVQTWIKGIIGGNL